MPAILYRLHDGSVRRVDAEAGTSVMKAAVWNDVPGIVGECGGECACATCHVYVAGEFVGRLPPIGGSEEEMLGFVASERRPDSRLGCQIKLTVELDGLEVSVPQRQIP